MPDVKNAAAAGGSHEPPAPAHRPMEAIEAEHAETQALFLRQMAENDDYHARRNRALKKREKALANWQKENPGEPVDPEDFPIPSPNSPVGVAFHKTHYRLAELVKEMQAAKTAITGF